MRNIVSVISVLLFISLVSCGMDEFDEPAETLKGAVIDMYTNEPIQTEQPNGYRIKLEDIGWSDTPVPIYFWGKPDGTFQNTKVYKSEYMVTPVEGAFLPVEGVTLKIKGTVEQNFTVTPYVSVEVSDIKAENNSIKVTYTVTNRGNTNLQEAIVYVGLNNPNIGANFSTKSVKRTLKASDSGVQYTNEIKELTPGTYYVRVAARAKNPSNRYNMTKVTKIEL